MTGFDFEPEDAWDATDPPALQLVNIARRLLAVADSDLSRASVRYRLDAAAIDLDVLRGRL